MKPRLLTIILAIGTILWVCLTPATARGSLAPEPEDGLSTPPGSVYLPVIFMPYVIPDCPALAMPTGAWETPEKPGKGFSWPYFLYVPPEIGSAHALVVPNNTGRWDDDFCVHRQRAWEQMLSFTHWADGLGVPLIVPVFPRFDDGTDWTVTSQYLGRGTLEAYWQERFPLLARQDLQLIAMIDDARGTLAPTPIGPKVLLWGYSASGMFVSRFAILHPDRVQGATIGGHGWTSAPVTEWEGMALPYPYGAGDLQELIGAPTDLAEFRRIPLYIYMGAEDTNGWALPWYIGMEKDWAQYDELFTNRFGTSAPSLLSSARMIFDSLGCAADFVLFPGTGHGITQEMNESAFNFLKEHR